MYAVHTLLKKKKDNIYTNCVAYQTGFLTSRLFAVFRKVRRTWCDSNKKWRKSGISTGSPFRARSADFCCIRADARTLQSSVDYERTRHIQALVREIMTKMNMKWRTQRHLSIRDLDWRSLFLSDSSFRAIDDHTGLAREERLGVFFFF